MKQILKVALTLTAVLTLLLSALSTMSVSAALTEEQDQVRADYLTETVNPNATQEAKSLLAYLSSLSDTKQFVTGVFDMAMDSNVYNEVKDQFGAEAALYSEKYLVVTKDDTPREGLKALDFYDVDPVNDNLQEHYENGNILLVQDEERPLETFAPLAEEQGLEFDDSCTGMVMHWDETNPDRNMAIYEAHQHYNRSLIEALKDLEARGVNAYMLRIFVELELKPANGGSDEAHQAFVNVWRQFVDDLIEEGLKGFLMTFAPTFWSDTYSRYPGNNYVDVVSATVYSDYGGELKAGSFAGYDWFVRTGKPIGLSELGCRHGGWRKVSQQARCSWFDTLHSMVTNWPRITWVNCWGDDYYALTDYYDGSRIKGNDDGALFIHSPYSVTLDELPPIYTSVIHNPGVARLYTASDCSGDFTGLEEKLYTQSDLENIGITLSDVKSLYVNQGFGVYLHAKSDGSGEKWGYMGRANSLNRVDMNAVKAIEVFHLENAALKKTVTASANTKYAGRVNDGLSSCWTADTGTGWLMVDLGAPTTVSRYVVRHAGAVGEPSAYNTSDFRLEYSNDGTNWKTIDSVTGNVYSLTDRTISPFTARYVRLYITKGNSAESENVLTIAELELYGAVDVPVETAPITSLGAQIRDGKNDLRFGFTLVCEGVTYADEGTYTANYANATVEIGGKTFTVQKVGSIVAVKDLLEGERLERNDEQGSVVKDVPAEKIYELGENYVTYTAVVVDIPDAHSDTVIVARPYIVYANENGVEATLYGDVIEKSYSQVTENITSDRQPTTGSR